MRERLPAPKIQTQEENMSFAVQHLRVLRDACIWELPRQMAYLNIAGNPIVVFPQYFLRVKTGEVIRKIEDLPDKCAVLTALQQVVKEQLPVRDPDDRMEVVYDGVCRVFTSNSARQMAHWLCQPAYVGKYQELEQRQLTIRKEWYWRPDPDKIKIEVLVYPKPCSFDSIEVEEHWVNPRTLDIKIGVPYNDNYLIIGLCNDVLEHIAWLTLPNED
jgi:hypothetical protein